jgi:cytochrome c oxidase subunit IV
MTNVIQERGTHVIKLKFVSYIIHDILLIFSNMSLLQDTFVFCGFNRWGSKYNNRIIIVTLINNIFLLM